MCENLIFDRLRANMAVAELGLLHGRYVRLSDRFKSMWTYHQFASGVYKNLIGEPLPYKLDFQNTFDRIKAAGANLTVAHVHEASSSLGLCELALDRAALQMLTADEKMSASVLRRFFEKLKKQDENIIEQIIKFYLYTDSVEGDHLDKLDFLFTRIGEHFFSDRRESWMRDSLEFREKIISLVSLLRVIDAPQAEVVRLIRAVRSIREQIQNAKAFEDLTEKNLLNDARSFKHRLGDLYFHPDILLAIVELNIATGQKFATLFAEDEQRMLDDSQNLLEHGTAIERNFGDSNPELVREIARFRQFKERFDASRAESNVKHDVITHLKQSIANILAQLDRGLGPEEDSDAAADLPPAFFSDAERLENIRGRFGVDPDLEPFLMQIGAVVDPLDPARMPEEAVEIPAVNDLRLEPWEIAAYQKLFERRAAEGEEDTEELWQLYVRGSALRLRIDEEATQLASAIGSGAVAGSAIMARARTSLDHAKELDESFSHLLREAMSYSNPKILHQLYRSRFRLLRGFSGLWLIYDRGGHPGA